MLLNRARLAIGGAVVLLLVLGGRSVVPAAAQNAPTSVACSAGAVGLDTCLVTIGSGIPPGDTMTAELEAPGAVIVGCQGFVAGANCSVGDGSILLACPGGCPPGSEFEEAVQTFAGVDLAQQFTVAGPVAPSFAAATLQPQMSDSCLSGVSTAIGCVPSMSYLAYRGCMNSWMSACPFNLGYRYTGYYFPQTATYAFYVPVGNYYSFYAPSSTSYYAFYNPTVQTFSYFNPGNGYYAAAYPSVPITAAVSADTISPLFTSFATAPFITPTVAAFFAPATAGPSISIATAGAPRFTVSITTTSAFGPTGTFAAPPAPPGFFGSAPVVTAAPAAAIALDPPVPVDPPAPRRTQGGGGAISDPAPDAGPAAHVAPAVAAPSGAGRHGDAAQYAPPPPSVAFSGAPASQGDGGGRGQDAGARAGGGGPAAAPAAAPAAVYAAGRGASPAAPGPAAAGPRDAGGPRVAGPQAQQGGGDGGHGAPQMGGGGQPRAGGGGDGGHGHH